MNMMVSNNEDLSKKVAFESFIQKWTSELLPKIGSADVKKMNPSALFHCIPLEHQYTELNIAFMGLKGNDSQLAKLVSNHSNLHVFLALQCKFMEGQTDSHCDENECDLKLGCWAQDDVFHDHFSFRDEEETDASYSMGSLSDMYGAKLPLKLKVDDFHEDLDVIFPDLAVKARLLPAGNEGATVEKWYYSACLMITPKAALYPFLVARTGFKFFLTFISSSLIRMKLTMDLLHIPLPDYATEYYSFIDSALATQTTIDMDCIHQLLAFHLAMDFPSVFGSIPDFLWNKSEKDFRKILGWSVEEVLCFILCLIPSGDSIFFHHVRDALVDDAKSKIGNCFLHRFLASGKVWKKVDEFSDWPVFMKLMKELCLARITSLKEVPAPNMNTWSFPDAQVDDSSLQEFLLSEEETKEFEMDHYWETMEEDFEKQKNFSAIVETLADDDMIKVTKTKEFFQKKLTAFNELQEKVLELEERARKLK
jgi:hypothetical protein